ncbi:hypothetical protein [Algoriphagus terrigena]|uniref:hypothetical protein n=1 Tax=Algoriphagus terrigena TaxID=344884 RepID=UPI0004038D03|nr:hypothetical protein [Algoriphagus terrigena]
MIIPHVVQFSWAGRQEVDRLSAIAAQLGIAFYHYPVSRSPHPAIGSLFAVWKARTPLGALIQEKGIEVVMPRSTMPAWIVLRLLSRSRALPEIIFDADGLPIQERIDFAGLREGSLMHRFLYSIESAMLRKADKVLVRSNRAKEIHLENNPSLDPSKFFKVGNGRDEALFYVDHAAKDIRAKLGIGEEELLLVHSGSLGGGYESSTMFDLLQNLYERGLAVRLLLLTRDEKTARNLVPDSLQSLVSVISFEFESIPELLRASDIGICLRKKSKSIAGIAPIKLGEYLMCGLPVIYSEGIGDFDSMLSDLPFVFRMGESYDAQAFLNWQDRMRGVNRAEVGEFGRMYFSLESTLDSYQTALSR